MIKSGVIMSEGTAAEQVSVLQRFIEDCIKDQSFALTALLENYIVFVINPGEKVAHLKEFKLLKNAVSAWGAANARNALGKMQPGQDRELSRYGLTLDEARKWEATQHRVMGGYTGDVWFVNYSKLLSGFFSSFPPLARQLQRTFFFRPDRHADRGCGA
jgi:hypothetical protein